jgi:hypothetical protein
MAASCTPYMPHTRELPCFCTRRGRQCSSCSREASHRAIRAWRPTLECELGRQNGEEEEGGICPTGGSSSGTCSDGQRDQLAARGRTWALAATHTFFLRPGTSIQLGTTWEQKSIVMRRDETAAVLDFPATPLDKDGSIECRCIFQEMMPCQPAMRGCGRKLSSARS